MKTLDLYKAVFGAPELFSKSELIENLGLIDIAHSLTAAAIDTLNAAFKNGPLSAGDEPSKAGRDELLSHGLVAQVISTGKWGFSACTHKGAWVRRILEATGA